MTERDSCRLHRLQGVGMAVPGNSGLRWEPKKPELRYPSMFAAWPGMGNVALVAAQNLVEKLGMKPLGSIDASTYVLADGILVQKQKIMPLRLPEYRFHYYRRPAHGVDLIVFTGDTQPSQPQGYSLARLVIKAAETWGVQRVYTGAALACSITHMEKPRVWGVATHSEIWADFTRAGVEPLQDGQISGLNGLLLGVAKQAGFEGVCLLGELPYYTIGMENPKSSQAVLEKLCAFLDLELDFSDLREAALKKEMEIEEFIRRGENEAMLQQMLESASEPEKPQ